MKAKKTCLFLRGLVREIGHWNGFLERFAAAFPDCEAIALDLPGSGSRFQEQSPSTMRALAESVRAEFQGVKGEVNYIFALSLGGMMAVEWMRLYPGDFAGLVLVNSSMRGLNPFWQRLRPRSYLPIFGNVVLGNAERIERAILRITSARAEEHPELVADWVRIRQSRPVSLKNSLRQLKAAAAYRPPTNRPLVPLIALNGAGDRLVAPACSQTMAERWQIPLFIHPTAGHDLPLDEPEWVLEKLRETGFF